MDNYVEINKVNLSIINICSGKILKKVEFNTIFTD